MTPVLLNKPPGFPFYFITGEIPDIALKTLEQELSYSVQSADYALAALAEKHAKENIEREKEGLPIKEFPPWDGKVHFLKKAKNGKLYFPCGLKQKVIDILAFYDIGTTLREEYNECSIRGKFEWHGPALRDYQVDAAIKAIASGGGILSMPTGSGKSLLALRLIYVYGLKSIILVHRKELFNQWCGLVEKTFGLQGVKHGNGIVIFPVKDQEISITIAMIQTLHSGLSGKNPFSATVLESGHDLVILDECHHAPCDTFYTVKMKIDSRYSFGFSATIQREDGADLKMEAALGPIVVKMQAADLIKSHHLVLPVFEFIDFPASEIKGKTFAQIYRNGIVMNEERNLAIARRVQELIAEGRQVLVCVEQIIHGETISRLAKIPFVCSKSKDREETLETFKKGYTRALCTTLLDEGFDLPEISSVVMAGGRKTKIGTIQKVGRALRPDPKFSNVKIVDFADRGRYLAEHTRARYLCYLETYGEDVVLRGRKG